MKERLDVMMTARGLAESREKAKALIMAGVVFVDGQREDKAGQNFPSARIPQTFFPFKKRSFTHLMEREIS